MYKAPVEAPSTIRNQIKKDPLHITNFPWGLKKQSHVKHAILHGTVAQICDPDGPLLRSSNSRLSPRL